jgi:hypothetical protein
VHNLAVRSQARHMATQAASHRRYTAAARLQYIARAGSEGTHEQASRRYGLRQNRYRGHAKPYLQHMITAASTRCRPSGGIPLMSPIEFIINSCTEDSYSRESLFLHVSPSRNALTVGLRTVAAVPHKR